MSGAAEKLRDEAIVAERVQRRTMTSRRRRFVRGIAILAVLTAGMVLVSMVHRDTQAMEQCDEQADYVAGEFSTEYRNRKLPILLPHRKEDREWVLGHYDYRLVNDRFFGQEGEGEVGVCCCLEPHRLLLREEGRNVVLFDGDGFRVKWMPESEFKQRATELRLQVPDDD